MVVHAPMHARAQPCLECPARKRAALIVCRPEAFVYIIQGIAMSKVDRIRPFKTACGVSVTVLALYGMPLSSWAQTVALLSNASFTGGNTSTNTLPSGYWDQRRVDGPCASTTSFPVTYAYGTDVDGASYMDIDVNNTSSCSANYVLAMPVNSGESSLVMSADYKFTATLKVISHDGSSRGSLGFHLNGSDGNYVGEAPGYYANGTAADQTPTLDYTGGDALINGTVPASMLPRLAAYSIKAGQHLKLRLKNLSLTRSSAPTAVTVNGLVNPVLMVASDKLLKLSVPIKTIGYSGSAVSSTVMFMDVNNVLKATWSHPATFLGASKWGNTYDTYQDSLPLLPPGRYAIRYSLPLTPSLLQGGTGATETVTSSGAKRYDIGTLVVSDKGGMYVGQHFHRYPGPNSDPSTGVPLPSGFAYRFARSLNHDGTVDPNNGMTLLKWWTGDGVYDWTLFDKWAEFHAGKDATAKKRLLITFMGSPSWLTSNSNYNNYYADPGLLAAPKDLAVYKRMVTATVNRYKDRTFAVECWNEPDAGYFGGNPLLTGTSVPTQLADVCKAIHTATKAVDPTIATICPQTAIPENMQAWLSARTSQNEPITDYCDVVGAHAYGRIGTSAAGQDYFNRSEGLIQTVKTMKAALQLMGVKKPLGITEAGFLDSGAQNWAGSTVGAVGTVFSQKTPTERATISYQTLATARELGVVLYGLYSFDGGGNPDAPLGFEGNAFGTAAATANQVVNTQNAAATTDLGAGAATDGVQPFALDLFMVPSVTSVAWSGSNTTLNFKISVANTTLLAGKSLAVSIVPSATRYEHPNGTTGTTTTSVYTIDSLTGPGGSCTASQPTVGGQTVTQWTCQNMTVAAGDVVNLTASGHMTPAAAQVGWMNTANYSYYFTVTSTASWADRPSSVSIPTVTSAKLVLSK